MIHTFEMQRSRGTKIEGVIFSDGSCSVRQLSEDPCSRITFTFEGVSECEAELGIEVPNGAPPQLGGSRYHLDRRLLDAPPPPCRYTAEDNGPEPEDVEA